MKNRFSYARRATLLFTLPIAFNATMSKCSSANEMIIHFFEQLLHFNLIL